MRLRAAVVPPAEAREELWAATYFLRKVPGVVPQPMDLLEIPITGFGNLTLPDVDRLVGVLRRAFEGADAPVVRCKGLFPGRPTDVAVALDGEVDQLVDLARFIPEAAKRLRLYVDRRTFRPAITVASVGPDTSAHVMTAALRSVQNWEGSSWPLPGLSLIRDRWVEGESQAEEVDLIALV